MASITSGGIIPAGAGRRSRKSPSSATTRDHPRGCGEKNRALGYLKRVQGSSPRVRGEASPGRPPTAATGIIPAGAGRRELWIASKVAKGDHPRGCGEKYGVDNAFVDAQGSSPRVRGEG